MKNQLLAVNGVLRGHDDKGGLGTTTVIDDPYGAAMTRIDEREELSKYQA